MAKPFEAENIQNKCQHLIICEGYDDDTINLTGFNLKNIDDACFITLIGTAFNQKNILNEHKQKGINKISLMLSGDDSARLETFKSIAELLKEDIYPNIIFDFNYKTKPIKKYSSAELQKLLDNCCYGWFDYLTKCIENELFSKEELLPIIKSIKNNKKKGFYATKFYAIFNNYDKINIPQEKYQNILSLEPDKIKDYFLEEESYFNCKLPNYFSFKGHLDWAINKVKEVKTDYYKKFKDTEDVNYKILGNKNGEYAWRQYQIINPILYVEMVNLIGDSWDILKTHFAKNKVIEGKIKCSSLSVIKNKDDHFASNTARQIINWWEEVEQESIKQSLKYRYIINTDITDCYGSIYTHSIPWALCTKQTAKDIHGFLNNKEKKKKYKEEYQKNYEASEEYKLGDKIDNLLKCMNHGQTNGIPQGSAIMDFIAEILLHYMDLELHKKCEQEKLEYYILRYRDDYRIFANDAETAKKVLKFLGEVLIENGGMRLSTDKTNASNCVISSSLKKDKIDYLMSFSEHEHIEKNILNIYLFAKKHSNSGSLQKLLQSFRNKIKDKIAEISIKMLDDSEIKYRIDVLYIVSILSEIMHQNTRTYGVCCSIIFDLMPIIENDERKKIFENIKDKMSTVPNNELLYIWLERMVYLNPDDLDGWGTFFKDCETKNTLLYKAYNKTQIWNFPTKNQDEDEELAKLSILSEDMIIKLDKAKKKEKQNIDVNKEFTEDEVNAFGKNYLNG